MFVREYFDELKAAAAKIYFLDLALFSKEIPIYEFPRWTAPSVLS